MWARAVGWVLHIAVGGMMLAAGAGKVFGFAPEEMVAKLKDSNLGEEIVLIGCGEMVSAVLLLLPWTAPLGVLLVSGFWGGTIVYHMTRSEPYWMQASFLAAMWLGAWLRHVPGIDALCCPGIQETKTPRP